MRLRHKIEKAGAAKQRKARKESKKNPQWVSRLKKDPGIPNLFPFKDKILADIEEKKRRKVEDAQRARDAAKASKGEHVEVEVDDEDDDGEDEMLEDEMDEDVEEDGDNSDPMAALLASAQARAAEYGDAPAGDMDDDDQADSNAVEISSPFSTNYKNPDSSRKTFDKIFKTVLEQADVILYVLDARDPTGTRSREVERQIMSAASGSKRLILILNKIDLIPPPVLKAWLVHLRRYFPTIPLRASMPASNAHTFDHKQLTPKNTSETLLRALKSYAATKQMKRSIAVGVIGYPNVGKSSVINALTSRLNKGAQSSACPVGSEAGVTTSLREVKIDNKLKILDSPGIVFPAEVSSATAKKSENEARLILLNALPPAQISDPVPAVSLLLSRLSESQTLYEKLLSYYGIVGLGPFGKGDITSDFLIQVARKRGRLGKGGVPNMNAAAMTVITDWRDGRIQGWVEAPTLKVEMDQEMVLGDDTPDQATGADRKEIVKEWSAEFKLDGLWGNGTGAEMDIET